MFGFGHQDKRQKDIKELIKQTFGYSPRKISTFEMALRHRSATSRPGEPVKESNERLEFLGDAVLDAVIADYLFASYPLADEGELTKLRAKIVNRETLNLIAQKAGISDSVDFILAPGQSGVTLGGNALESLIGALYLEKGFDFAKKCTLRFFRKYLDFTDLQQLAIDFKSNLLELAQKNKFHLVVEHSLSQNNSSSPQTFTANILLDGKVIASGIGSSKKKAEQEASRQALLELELLSG